MGFGDGENKMDFVGVGVGEGLTILGIGRMLPPGPEHRYVPKDSEHIVVPPGPEHLIVPKDSEHIVVPSGPLQRIVPKDSEHVVVPPEPEHLQVPKDCEQVVVPPAPEHRNVPKDSEHVIVPFGPVHRQVPKDSEQEVVSALAGVWLTAKLAMTVMPPTVKSGTGINPIARERLMSEFEISLRSFISPTSSKNLGRRILLTGLSFL